MGEIPVEGEGLTFSELHFLFGEVPDPDLRTLRVQNEGNRGVHLLRDLFDEIDSLFVFFMTSMGEVEPGGIHACGNECPYLFLALNCGTNRAYDFSLSHGRHFIRYIHFLNTE